MTRPAAGDEEEGAASVPGDDQASRDGVPTSVEIVSGLGGLFLVVGIVLLGMSRLERGTWGGWGGVPAGVAIVGVVILGGASLSWAVRGRDGD